MNTFILFLFLFCTSNITQTCKASDAPSTHPGGRVVAAGAGAGAGSSGSGDAPPYEEPMALCEDDDPLASPTAGRVVLHAGSSGEGGGGEQGAGTAKKEPDLTIISRMALDLKEDHEAAFYSLVKLACPESTLHPNLVPGFMADQSSQWLQKARTILILGQAFRNMPPDPTSSDTPEHASITENYNRVVLGLMSYMMNLPDTPEGKDKLAQLLKNLTSEGVSQLLFKGTHHFIRDILNRILTATDRRPHPAAHAAALLRCLCRLEMDLPAQRSIHRLTELPASLKDTAPPRDDTPGLVPLILEGGHLHDVAALLSIFEREHFGSTTVATGFLEWVTKLHSAIQRRVDTLPFDSPVA